MASSNLLNGAIDRLDAFLDQKVSEPIVYRPVGESRTAALRATPSGSRVDTDQNDSMQIDSDHQDFIVFMDTPVNCSSESFGRWLGRDPNQNDEIIFNGHRYLVTPVTGGESHRYRGSRRTSVRIHTVHSGVR